MLTASEISALIRKKKKEQESGVEQMSGVGLDVIDTDGMKRMEATDALNMNHPMAHSDGEDSSPSAEMAMEEEEDPEEKAARMGRMQRVKMTIGKMGFDI